MSQIHENQASSLPFTAGYKRYSKRHCNHCGTLIFLLLILIFMLSNHFSYAINVSESLSQKFWLIHLNAKPKRNDYILFRSPPNIGLEADATIIKQVAGIPGDEVLRRGRNFFINEEYIATAKSHSLAGDPLEPGFEGILKKGQYYVHSPHPDSFDSRYAAFGLVDSMQHLGVAYPLW